MCWWKQIRPSSESNDYIFFTLLLKIACVVTNERECWVANKINYFWGKKNKDLKINYSIKWQFFFVHIGDWRLIHLKNFVNGCFERIWRSWIVWFLMKIRFAKFFYSFESMKKNFEFTDAKCDWALFYIIRLFTEWLIYESEEQPSSESKPCLSRNSVCNLCLNKFLAIFNALNFLFPY